MNHISFEEFESRVNIACALDHSSRAGNYFFQSLFDQHEEVLTCPWIQYTYSYIVTEFGSAAELDANVAHRLMSEKSYFRLVYNEAEGSIRDTIISFGSDPEADIDREVIRRTFDDIVRSSSRISRRSLVLASFYAYAKGVGRDINRIQYVLVSDAMTLRSERAVEGYSARTFFAVKEDFPEAKFFSLERDPRASLASCWHQYTIANDNIQGLSLGNFWRRVRELLTFTSDTDGCVYLYWLMYASSSARRMYELKRLHPDQIFTVKNEDLNLDFHPTIRQVVSWLGVSSLSQWNQDPYNPTNVGKPWLGKGAYSSRYQSDKGSLLKNDPAEISKTLTGPNEYVTRRWRNRLRKNEKAVIEFLFRDILHDLGYDFTVFSDGKFSLSKFLLHVLKPFSGEMPTVSWIRGGLENGRFMDRTFYSLVFPLLYILARIQLLRQIAGGRQFELMPEGVRPKEFGVSYSTNVATLSSERPRETANP